MSAARHLIAAAAVAGAIMLARAGKHAEEARALLGPTGRAAVDEIREADIPAGEALTAAQAAQQAQEERGKD